MNREGKDKEGDWRGEKTELKIAVSIQQAWPAEELSDRALFTHMN